MTSNIVIIDDEEPVLKALRRELSGVEGWNLHFFQNPAEGLQAISRVQADVVISDVRMPNIDGISLIQALAKNIPHTYRILLSGYAEIDDCIEAINRGNVHQFFEKPWDPDLLRSAVEKGCEYSRLKRENVELLEKTQKQNIELEQLNEDLEKVVEQRTELLRKTYISTLQTLIELTEGRMRQLNRFSPKGPALVRALAKALDLEEEQQKPLEWALRLKAIGLVNFSDELLTKHVTDMSEEQKEIYHQYPLLSALAISSIEPMDSVADIISQHEENMDGSGFPKGLKKEHISLPARVLRVVSDYLDGKLGFIDGRAWSSQESIANLQARAGSIYDKTVVDALSRLITTDESEESDDHIVVQSALGLKPGMTLAADLFMPNGVLLLSAGTSLRANHIEHIQMVESNQSIAFTISVSSGID